MKIQSGIHAGDNTHHQDQSMTFVSFRTTKATRRSPDTPTPLLEEEESLILFVFKVIVNEFTDESRDSATIRRNLLSDFFQKLGFYIEKEFYHLNEY